MSGREAYNQMKQGKRVRLPHWPAGQYLKMIRPGANDSRVAVYREFSLSSPSHQPSKDEFVSNAWEVLELPADVEERNRLA